MNTAYVTSAPVIVASPAAEHPVTTNRRSLRGIGITGILIGLYAIGFGGYYVVAASSPVVYDHEYAFSSYGGLVIGAGVWFIIAGSLAVAASCSPTSCHINGGIVLAILASLAAFGLLVKQGMMVFALLSVCGEYCSAIGGTIFAHVLLVILALVEFILAIVHASISCSCCGRKGTPQVQTAMAITTTTHGKGYSPLQNEQGYASAYPPQKTAGGPPAYY